MSTKKAARQSTLTGFFTKTPSKEIRAQVGPVAPLSPPLTVPEISTPTIDRTSRQSRQVASIIEEDSNGDDDLEDALPSSRPRKRRKTTQLESSDDDYCDSMADDDMLEAELSSSANPMSKSSKVSRQPPPKMNFERSESRNQKLASFMSSPRNPLAEVAENEMSIRSDHSKPPSLKRDTSSRVSAIVPMSKQDQLVEGG